MDGREVLKMLQKSMQIWTTPWRRGKPHLPMETMGLKAPAATRWNLWRDCFLNSCFREDKNKLQMEFTNPFASCGTADTEMLLLLPYRGPLVALRPGPWLTEWLTWRLKPRQNNGLHAVPLGLVLGNCSLRTQITALLCSPMGEVRMSVLPPLFHRHSVTSYANTSRPWFLWRYRTRGLRAWWVDLEKELDVMEWAVNCASGKATTVLIYQQGLFLTFILLLTDLNLLSSPIACPRLYLFI